MLTGLIQFNHSKQNERNFTEVAGKNVQGIRVTAETIEFKFREDNGADRYMVMKGEGLPVLSTRIHDNQLKKFHIGSPIPGVTIRAIEKADHFTYPSGIDMGPERNRLKSSLFCVDTSRERIYTPFHSISKFCSGKGRDYRLLVYVDGGFSFILHPQRLPGGAVDTDDFDQLLRRMKAANFAHGTTNKISPFGDYFYQQGGDPDRYLCRLVEFKPGDVSMSGEWSVIMDFTTQKAPAPAVPPPAIRKPIRMPPSVGMDL